MVETQAGLACAISEADQHLYCWGHESAESPPAGRDFIDVSIGSRDACAVHAGGRVSCWKHYVTGELTSPTERFTDIAVSRGSACGILADAGRLRCWGPSAPTPPTGEFTQIDAQNVGYCALRSDDTIVCWGRSEDQIDGTFSSVNGMCGVRVDGSSDCMFPGLALNLRNTDNMDMIEAACFFGGAMLGGGQALPWGAMSDPAIAPAANVIDVALAGDDGEDGVCWLLEDLREVRCVGEGSAQLNGTFEAIDADDLMLCGMTASGTVSCTDNDDPTVHIDPPEGTVARQLAVGQTHACVIVEDGNIIC